MLIRWCKRKLSFGDGRWDVGRGGGEPRVVDAESGLTLLLHPPPLGTQHHTSSDMVKGKEYSEDLRWVVVRMASILSVETIAVYTNISQRQILRILSCYRRTGQVLDPDRTSKTGRKHHLSDVELAVSNHICLGFACAEWRREVLAERSERNLRCLSRRVEKGAGERDWNTSI